MFDGSKQSIENTSIRNMWTNFYRFLFSSLLVILSFGKIETSSIYQNAFRIRIVHTNDMHGRFEQTSRDSAECQPSDAAEGKCYGGFARLATLIRNFRSDSSIPTIYLDAGDTYEGSTLYTHYKWEIVSKFLNLLNPDAISLGNHEFDDGPQGLLPFLKAAKFPIVSSNLVFSNRSELTRYIKKSVIINVSNRKIGVVSYLTPETSATAQVGSVVLLNEVESIREEVNILQNQGINIIIALGHSGYLMDQKIAEEVEGIDLVVGGHTHSFLGKKVDDEVSQGPYPTVITQKSGKKIYVVQAHAYTKYLGHLQVDFDDQGEVINMTGQPILVDGSVEAAEDIEEELNRWRPALDELMREPVGRSRVVLDGTMGSCRKGECNMGNLIVDAMVDYNSRHNHHENGWTDAPIAFHNSGNIRASINKTTDEIITMNDIVTVLPYQNGIVKVEATGTTILKILEWSVYKLRPTDIYLSGTFMQHSGIKVIYDLSKPSGSKVNRVEVRCGECPIPKYSHLEMNKKYKILTTDYLLNGGDKFAMLKNLNWSALGVTTDAVVADYIKQTSPIVIGIEGRIRFVKPSAAPLKRPVSNSICPLVVNSL